MSAEAENILKAIETLTKAIADRQVAALEAQKQAGIVDRAWKETKKRLELKNMKTVEFSGEKDKWDEWSFNFASGIRAQNSEMYKSMIMAEEAKEDLHGVMPSHPAGTLLQPSTRCWASDVSCA